MTAFRLGLTGSIGMGKSTTAAFFAEKDIPVWDADACVHRLYAKSGLLVPLFAARWPQVVRDGAIDRAALKTLIATDPTVLSEIESLVHPAVAKDRDDFIARAKADIVVLDIPLLFEKNTQSALDATLLVTAPPEVQRARVLARPGMTEAQFETILARQMPDTQKRSLATHIIETLSLASAEACVTALIDHIRKSRHA
jgi:dephospho-CoA kinase